MNIDFRLRQISARRIMSLQVSSEIHSSLTIGTPSLGLQFEQSELYNLSREPPPSQKMERDQISAYMGVVVRKRMRIILHRPLDGPKLTIWVFCTLFSAIFRDYSSKCSHMLNHSPLPPPGVFKLVMSFLREDDQLNCGVNRCVPRNTGPIGPSLKYHRADSLDPQENQRCPTHSLNRCMEGGYLFQNRSDFH